MFRWLQAWPARSRASARAPETPAPPARKSALPFPLVAFSGLAQPAWSEGDFAGFARSGYMRNPVVYRAVRMVAEGAASVPWLLREGAREFDRHPLLDLLARPNGQDAGRDLLEAAYTHLLVSGNAFVEAVSVEGRIRALHVLRPDRMRVLLDDRGWPAGYAYTAGGRTVRFAAEGEPQAPILHLRMLHPLDDAYGLAPAAAAHRSLDLHNASAEWNKALLDNAARPSGALVYEGRDGANLSEEQFGRLRAELDESFSGARNAGRPLLLEGGLDWRPMSLSPKDMDFLEARNLAAREIALAFGVPPMLLGIPGDNTYSNYREANVAFWRQTVLPLAERTAARFAAWLGPAFGGDLAFGCDPDRVEALSQDREALWRRVLSADVLSVNEKRDALGYAPIPGGDAPGSPAPGQAWGPVPPTGG